MYVYIQLAIMLRRRAKRERACRGEGSFVDRKGSRETRDEDPVGRKKEEDEALEEERLESLVFGGQPFASHSDDEEPSVDEVNARGGG